MLYPLRAEGFGSHEIAIKVNGFSEPIVLVNGTPAPQAAKKNQFTLTREDGTNAIAELRVTNLLDPVPTVILDGNTVKVTNSLAWHEYIVIGLPILLVGIGGAIGGAIGVSATYLNGRVMRSSLHPVMRYAAAIGVAIAAFAVWLAISLTIRSMIGR